MGKCDEITIVLFIHERPTSKCDFSHTLTPEFKIKCCIKSEATVLVYVSGFNAATDLRLRQIPFNGGSGPSWEWPSTLPRIKAGEKQRGSGTAHFEASSWKWKPQNSCQIKERLRSTRSRQSEIYKKYVLNFFFWTTRISLARSWISPFLMS